MTLITEKASEAKAKHWTTHMEDKQIHNEIHVLPDISHHAAK